MKSSIAPVLRSLGEVGQRKRNQKQQFPSTPQFSILNSQFSPSSTNIPWALGRDTLHASRDTKYEPLNTKYACPVANRPLPLFAVGSYEIQNMLVVFSISQKDKMLYKNNRPARPHPLSDEQPATRYLGPQVEIRFFHNSKLKIQNSKLRILCFEQFAQACQNFQIFSNIFKRFTQIFEYFRTFYTSFQTFSIVFERFNPTYSTQTIQFNLPTPVFTPKINIPPRKNLKKPNFYEFLTIFTLPILTTLVRRPVRRSFSEVGSLGEGGCTFGAEISQQLHQIYEEGNFTTCCVFWMARRFSLCFCRLAWLYIVPGRIGS